MTAETTAGHEPAGEQLVLQEPSQWQSFWASLSALVAKESRWRMRGRRAFAIITVYVALLALLVVAAYQVMHDRAVFIGGFEQMPPSDFVSGSVSVEIGRVIFGAILAVQTLLTLLLAPALTSGSISMEREKQTLELLITTPVSTLGMVVGKLISSLGYVFLLIVASVPLMSLVFTFGGVAPDDVMRAYVVLFAMTVGIGSVGLFMSGLIKRTQIATALSYVVVLALTVGSLVLHIYLDVTSQRMARFADGVDRSGAPEVILLLNPVIADVDLVCTAFADSFGACAYIARITGQPLDPANPPRDLFWPRSVASFIVLGVGLTLATTQLIAPSRRIRRERPPAAMPASPVWEAPVDDAAPVDDGPRLAVETEPVQRRPTSSPGGPE